MPRTPRRSILAGLLSSLLLVALVAPASGYIEQRFSQVLLSGPNVVRCDRAATIKAKVVVTETGKPVDRQIVRWSLTQTQSSGDALSARSTVTNARGRTSVKLIFGPARGPRVVRASIAGGAPSITVRCSGGLPRTSAVPPADHVEAPPALQLAPPAVEPAPLDEQPATAIRMQRLGIDPNP